MNAGTSMWVGQAIVQGASWQNRHLFASSSAASFVSGGAMSAKFAASCSSVSAATLGTGTNRSPLPAPRSHAHPHDIDDSREDEADKPCPVVQSRKQAGRARSAQCCDEAGEIRRHAERKGEDGNPIDPVPVFVRALAPVQVVHDEDAATDEEVIGNHDARDRAE